MAGNSRRRGAVRKTGTKKGQVVGSGGNRKRGLSGKGPTPKATSRTGHPAVRRSERPTKSRPQRSRDRGRGGAATEMVAGRNTVVEALRAEVPTTTLYVAERVDADNRVREILRLASEQHVPVLEAPRAELDRLTGGAVHQGVAMAVPPYKYANQGDLVEAAHDMSEVPLIVALDGVTDPRNLGAVVRSAAAFGAHGVLVPERRSAGMTAGAWKSSAGAAARLPVAQATNLARALTTYRDAGLFVVGLDGEAETEISAAPTLDEPLCLVVGSEGKGLSQVVTGACDVVARIPIGSDVESLNAGVAAGIALYEVARARATWVESRHRK